MRPISHAIIVAAGLGRRIEGKSNGLPKSLITIGGKSLLHRSLENLKSRGVRSFEIVVGHQRQELMSACKGIAADFIFNPFYRTTNNMASLWCALRQTRAGNFYYLHSDILYDPRLLDIGVESASDVVLVTEEKACDAEAMKVSVKNGLLVEASKEVAESATFGEWTGIAVFNAMGKNKFIVEAERIMENQDFQAYDAKAFTGIAAQGVRVEVAGFKNIPWIEIDTEADLERAATETLAAL